VKIMVNKNQLQVKSLSKGIAFFGANRSGEPTQGAEALLGELEQGKEVFLFIVQEFKSYQNRLSPCDALLIDRGFSFFRKKDEEVQGMEESSLDIKAAQYLICNFNFHNYVIDTIWIVNIPQTKVYYCISLPVRKVLLIRKKKKAYLTEDINPKQLFDRNLKQLFSIHLKIFRTDVIPLTQLAEAEN